MSPPAESSRSPSILFQKFFRRANKVKKAKVADYSLVMDQNGEVVGFWFRNPSPIREDLKGSDRARHAHLRMLAVKESLDEDVYAAILLGNYRIVTNTFDDAGGCFVMLGSIAAPGEEDRTDLSLNPSL